MCASGACACSAGQTDCGGACRNLMNDAANCGRCGVACRSGACAGGACVPEQRSCATAGTVGCGLVEVAGGTFSMGSNTACTGSSGDPPDCAFQGSPVQPMITVSAFAIDAFEVTVARFRVFWNARMADGGASNRARPVAYPGGRFIAWDTPGNEPQQMGSGPSCNWNRTTGTRDAHPINCVEWRTALEFCVWDGGRLPTEAEWEFVARGRAVPDEGLVPGRIFPWGDDARALCGRAHVQGCPSDDAGLTRRVGSFSGQGGVFDLGGNVDEWTADTFAPYSDTLCWSMPRQTNPLCLSASPSGRTARGGSITSPVPRATSRYGWGSPSPMAFTGLRCVRSR
jgi:formylglycine-generating enzyme required for sulfatase activity